MQRELHSFLDEPASGRSMMSGRFSRGLVTQTLVWFSNSWAPSLAQAHVAFECWRADLQWCTPTHATRTEDAIPVHLPLQPATYPALRYAERSGPASVAITDESSKSNGLGDSTAVLEVTAFG